MKRNLTLCLVPLTIALGLGSVSCEQPQINCRTGRGGFAATYVLKAGSKVGTGDCDTLKGEIIGLEKYNPSEADDDYTQDLTKATLAIRSSTLGAVALAAEEAGFTDEEHLIYSIGDYTSIEPDEDDVCHVPALSVAEQDIPELSPEMPATNVQYAWSDVRIYTTANYPGTQMVANLTFTRDGCSASYSVTGLWPAVSCEVTDDEGNGTGMADAALCLPKADPEHGRETGSGINPDFEENVICDSALLLCVLKSPPEQLR